MCDMKFCYYTRFLRKQEIEDLIHCSCVTLKSIINEYLVIFDRTLNLDKQYN